MPEQTKSTTIDGVQYKMKLLGGRDAIAAGVIVSPSVLQAVDDVFSKLDLSGLKPGADIREMIATAFDTAGLEQLQKAHIPAALARCIQTLGIDGMNVLRDLFAKNTTVFLPSPADPNGKVFETPLTNRADDLWVGKFPIFLAWLTWGVWANGFFDVGQLLALLPQEKTPAPSSGPTASTASPGA